MSATRILVVCDDPNGKKEMANLLSRMGYEPAGHAGTEDHAIALALQTHPGLILVEGGPEFAVVASSLAKQRISPVVLIGSSTDPKLARQIAEGGVMGYVLKPVVESNLRPALEVALSRYREFEALARETNDLREQLETLRLVEQAKSVLMTQYNLSEAEASRRIRKASDDIRRPMGAIAEAILSAQSVAAAAG